MEPPGADNVDFSEIYAMDRIGYNMRQINFCRVFVAIVSGMASGILGLTGILGFLAFFGSTLLLSVGLYLSVGCNPRPYFKNPNDIWSEGISQAGMSYVLFWTLFYDVSPSTCLRTHRCPRPSCYSDSALAHSLRRDRALFPVVCRTDRPYLLR